MSQKKIATGAVVLAALAGLAAIAAILVYARRNGSGHTGMSPYVALALFVPVVVAGALHLTLLRGSGAAKWCGVCAILVGIAGVGLLVYLDQSNTLVQYEVWIERGMP